METERVKTVTISFEKEILKSIENARGRISRSRYVNDLIRNAMETPKET